MQSKLTANNVVVPPFEELSNPVGIGIFDWKICAQKRPLPSGREREQFESFGVCFCVCVVCTHAVLAVLSRLQLAREHWSARTA
jgi:hypothetical protein